MLDENLAEFYGVEVKRLNEQVKRNVERFPELFRFQLTDSDMEILRSQIVTSINGENLKSQFATSSWGGRRTKPYVFTEQGVAILAGVLKSETAKKSITIIDNYIDDTVLNHLTKRNNGVKVTIFTKTISKQLALDIKKFNAQYPPIEIKEFKNSHDRFIIIDNKTVYHFGASLKDLGKKWFAFSKMDIGAVDMLTRLEGMKVDAIKQ